MILQMRDICKDYPMGKTVTRVLKNVNLDVSEGDDFVAFPYGRSVVEGAGTTESTRDKFYSGM